MSMRILFVGAARLAELYFPASERAEGALFSIEVLPENASVEEMISVGRDTEVLITSPMSPATEALMDAMPRLRLIQSAGVGYQGIDLEAAAKRGIPVCNCAGMNANAVAEQAVLLMLALLRDAVRYDGVVRRGQQFETKIKRLNDMDLKELGECTVGIIGFGAIGRRTAELLRAFGARILVHNRSRLTPEEEEREGVTWCETDELLDESDIVSLSAPLNDATYHMADREFFQKMRPGSYLVNTARGELVDTEALLDAIRSGHLSGAGLDTIENEPVLPDNPLLLAEPEVEERLILSPHIGGVTGASLRRAGEMIRENIRRLIEGEEVLYRVV